MNIRRYLFPALLSALLLAAVFIAGNLSPSLVSRKRPVDGLAPERTKITMPEMPPDEPKVQIPHARVLCAVVEDDGIYIGEEFVPFLLFHKTLEDHANEWKADCAIVGGTTSSRFGRVTEAIDTVRAVLRVPVMMETMTMPDGARRIPITIHDYPFISDGRDYLPNKAAEPSRTTVTPPAGAGDRASGAPGSP